VNTFSQGDIIEVNFDPSKGHEPQSRCPALVVSTDEFNAMSSLTMLAPITSTDSGYPLHVRIGGSSGVTGFACIEQTRSLDLNARRCQLLGALGEEGMSEVLEKLGAVFGL